MQFYSKLIAAVVGILIILAGRYGIDLSDNQQLITDAFGSIVTAFGVWWLKNKPTTEAQVRVARDVANEGAQAVRDKEA